eukprot:SAG31_NODE_1292_length_8967_cov_2.998985_10_plen_173_part_00
MTVQKRRPLWRVRQINLSTAWNSPAMQRYVPHPPLQAALPSTSVWIHCTNVFPGTSVGPGLDLDARRGWFASGRVMMCWVSAGACEEQLRGPLAGNKCPLCLTLFFCHRIPERTKVGARADCAPTAIRAKDVFHALMTPSRYHPSSLSCSNSVGWACISGGASTLMGRVPPL